MNEQKFNININQPFTLVFDPRDDDWIHARTAGKLLKRLGYKASDNQWQPNGQYHEAIIVNATTNISVDASPPVYARGEYYFNVDTNSPGDRFCRYYRNFWAYNHFVDYCILASTEYPKDLPMHYIIMTASPDTQRMHKSIAYYPKKKNIKDGYIYRPATSWEVNAWLIKNDVINFPDRFFNLLTQEMESKEDYYYD